MGKYWFPIPWNLLYRVLKKTFVPDQKLWYQRNIELNEKKNQTKRYLLHFGAVDYRATITVNGKGNRWAYGGYQEFSVDITDACKKGNNELLVYCSGPHRQG